MTSQRGPVRGHIAAVEPNFVGIQILFRAYRYSLDTDGAIWDFAVEIATLEQAGLTRSEFRWLLAHGYVNHADEVTLPTSSSRQFRSLGRHQFTNTTCFVLNEKGVEFISHWRDGTESIESPIGIIDGMAEFRSTPFHDENSPDQNGRPCWDTCEKALRVGEVVVKQFRCPAPNQELLLDVFQEEAWPRRIDDPLFKVPDRDPRRRLHDTIKCLNRNQRNRLIRFRGDGTGSGVVWESVKRATPSSK